MKTFTFITISRCIVFRVRNVSEESGRENENTLMVNNVFPKIVQFIR